jgi:serine/threonine protein kinase
VTKIPADRVPGFELVREIGSGGMGTVYEARQLSLDRKVAIKLLNDEDLIGDPAAVERFRREAKAAAEIDHDNVVRIFDFGTTDTKLPYCVMELLPGRSLHQVLREEGPLAWPRVRALAVQMAAGMAAAHARGVIHRDLKPANCIVWSTDDGRERLKVLDFGIAKFEDASRSTAKPLTVPGTVVGSATYMSPEQFVEGTATARSDIYALGIVIHELLTGKPPFSAKQPMEVAGKHVREPPPPLTKLLPKLPVAVEAFVLRCLAKKADDRYPDMGAVTKALLELPGDPIVMPSPRSEATDDDVPSTDVLDMSESLGGDAEHTAILPPPTGAIEATSGSIEMGVSGIGAAAEEEDRVASEAEERAEAPRRHPRRASTAAFEGQLEAEGGGGRTWIVLIVLLLAAAGAAAIFMN